MKLTLKDADNIYNVLSKFNDQKLPIRLSYKIMKIVSGLETELDFYKRELQNIIQDCGEHDEEGNLIYTDDNQNIKLQQDKVEEFNERYFELINMDIDFKQFNFKLAELENLELTPKDLYILNNFIEDTDE
jgi:hypothetical protein